MWKWKTVCHASAPQELTRLTPSAPSSCLRADRLALRGERHRAQVLGVDAQQIRAVRAGDHEHVTARGGVDVHQGHCALVFVDDRPGQLAREDLAEDAIRIAHLDEA